MGGWEKQIEAGWLQGLTDTGLLETKERGFPEEVSLTMSTSDKMADAVRLKEEGNKYFQNQNYEEASRSYSQALKLAKDKALLATLYRNRAACGLKMESYAQAASDASKAIDINASDIKALFRRCQALEQLGKLDQAFKDVQRCATLEPKNQNFQETLRRLNSSIHEKLHVQFSTDSRVQKMFEILLDEKSETEKLEKNEPPFFVLRGKFDPQNMDKNVHAIQTVSGVLQGPFDLGNQLLGMKGVMEMMVALCGSDREQDQLVAVEALIHASTKLSRATFIITNGVTLLKDIYKTTKNEKIKIRTLVGLCKLGSAGGTDYGLRQFAEGSTEKLAKQCRKWLCNANIDARTRRWAVEGMAYLTLDADVKDDFVQDIPALQAMFELAKTSDKTILYSVATTLVNCTNSYDVKEVIPELVQLAKFSKQHVPEEHPKDKKDFVEKRVKRLLKAGVISALACMVKADSAILTDQTKELLARVFLALCDSAKDRGTIVAQGGGKALIPLALEGTDVGKVKAAHALAKIAAVSNPDIAFPGERVYEVVRPLVRLLDTQRDGLQNYEALLGLTKLSGRSDKLRQKIIKEKALPDIENYMFENHDQLRQAATECMCNMVVNKEVQERFLADGNDRLKLVVLLCGEDDDKVQNAAAGALAMLTASHKRLCHKMTQVTAQWLEILQRLCLHDRLSVQHRGIVIAYNLLAADQELARKLVESEMLEILTFVGKQEPDEKRKQVVEAARDCLIKCMDYGFIKPFS
ncbi:protein unc-45 homolog B [Petaurus breviceps papuanus]|uniref:protein unc-45 homolog B n=1 Tax=Petaurus breviceps papuanus TaxID=3040969 RepID=UPI0036DC65B3